MTWRIGGRIGGWTLGVVLLAAMTAPAQAQTPPPSGTPPVFRPPANPNQALPPAYPPNPQVPPGSTAQPVPTPYQPGGHYPPKPTAGPAPPRYPASPYPANPYPANPYPADPQHPPARPDQPVMPQNPTLQRRGAAPPQQLAAPFQLTPELQQYLDRVLLAWQERGQKVKTFDCNFVRWKYDGVFGQANKPRYIERGNLKYAAPDRGLFRITHTAREGQWAGIAPERAEHWICDGKSVFEYKYPGKQLIEHKLPPHLQGKAVQNGPLPFLFGADAAKLKQRYFLKPMPPPPPLDPRQYVCLEAWPRWQEDAADFKRAEFVINIKDVTPFGLNLYSPNDKDRTAFQFEDIVINDPFNAVKLNPFMALTPLGWTKIVDDPSASAPKVGRQPGTGGG